MSNAFTLSRIKTKIIFWLTLYILLLSCTLFSSVHAEEKFLSSEQAFQFNVESIRQDQAQLKWTIADYYYLYQHQFSVQQNGQSLQLALPKAEDKHDAYFGDTKVYYQKVAFEVKVKPDTKYQVIYQGCAAQGLCYPISQITFQTDPDGLVIQNNSGMTANSAQSLFNRSQNKSVFEQYQNTESVTNIKPSNDVIAQDQIWSTRLHQQSFGWSVLIFLGLGCLLAFTPCSLPMLPILSSLLVRKHVGVKAGAISIVFVLSMAAVYALLGIIAASAGSNFQRWLQQPSVLIGFSTIFILFALNLFGIFELKLPQSWTNRLDRLQSKQKGGTLFSASLMGMLSALLVGPCMTAPLAGTLLYISQTQNLFAGAVLLFTLGIGMGIPLIILSLIGEKALPKPDLWMNYVRHIFAFIMLGLSLYFVRPLLSIEWFNLGLAIVAFALMVYLLYLIKITKNWIRYSAILMLSILLIFTVYKGQQYWQYQHREQMNWQIVTNQVEFEQVLQQAKQKNQPIIIDLYADWCIACQPIERNVWTNHEIQQALQGITTIKLDLSRYDYSQQALLSQWQLLGPPTVLFLDQNAQEQRALRLTGEFQQTDLLQKLEMAKLKD